MNVIEAVRTALARGDARTALEHLLVAWRARPATALAEAIEAVGLFAARGMHPPGGTDAADREAQWLAEAERADPVMRQRLIETIADTSPAAAKVARAAVLAQTAADPRTAMALVALATARRMPHNEAYSTVWNPLFDMLVRSGDPRVRRAIERMRWEDVLRGTPKQNAAFRKRLAKYEEMLVRAFPTEPQLDREDARLVAEIIAMARAPAASDAADRETEASLLAAVRAAPGDLGARAIYADWLQERGDPRGEFIALQLAHPVPHPRGVPREISDRINQLLAQHRAKWLGDVDPYLSSDSFRRGFLEEATFKKQGSYDSAYVVPPPDPIWATVRSVRGGVPASDEHPMPILEQAREIDHRGMRALARLAAPPPLRVLGWRATDADLDGEAVADFAALLPRIPTLRCFRISGEAAAELAWAWRGSTIRELYVQAPSARLADWLAEEGLDELEVRHDNWHTVLKSSGELVAKQGYSGNFADVLPHLAAAIDRVAARITRLEITVGAKHEWRAPERKRMTELLVRHPRLAATAQIYGYQAPA